MKQSIPRNYHLPNTLNLQICTIGFEHYCAYPEERGFVGEEFFIASAPGSYPYAERYEINCSESDLILAIKKFKMENPGNNLPPQAQLKDGRRDENDHWYHVYFYYEKENKIVKTWVRKASEGTTTFAFVAINDGLTLGKWKEINNGYSKKENKLQKKKFEDLILNKITSQLK